MIGYFVYQQDSPFYESPKFTKVLKFVQTNPKNCQMNERNNKLRLVYTGIDSIAKALNHMRLI